MFKAAFAHCAALGAIFAFAAVAAHAQSVPRPDWKVGDTWTVAITVNAGIGGTSRREEVRVVKEAGENGYQVENTQKGGGAAVAPEILVLSRDLNAIVQSAALENRKNSNGCNGRSSLAALTSSNPAFRI